MRLESALYSSASGLDAHGDAISVIGDNVSNANTIAYKSGNVRFSDLLAEGPEEGSSTAEPVIGAGVEVAQVRQNHSSGVIESTGRALDLAIDGEGYLAVGDPSAPTYTRAGTLIIDDKGLLATASGHHVLGFTGIDTASIGTIDMLNIDTSGNPSSLIALAGNLNSTLSETTVVTDPATFNEVGSNASFTNSITAYDSLGDSHEVLVAFYRTEPNHWTVQAYIDGGEVQGEPGIPVQLGEDVELVFNGDGSLADESLNSAKIVATPQYSNGAIPGAFDLTFDRFTQFAGSNFTTVITQDGEGTGDIKGYDIQQDGSIVALLSSGTEVKVGTLPLSNFNNDEGLVRTGNALFTQSEVSGDPAVGIAGTEGFGTIQSRAL
ncbi:MAG: flagellar hook-basal body complex protein, partial [Bdellovibrionales bacterium]|nr:flagellar hook-basal body complex protein [Bdellovibrionales bacterium]